MGKGCLECYGLPARNDRTEEKNRRLRQLVPQPSIFLLEKRCRGLAEALLEVGADGLDELGAVDSLSLNTFHQVHEVLGNDTGVQGIEASSHQSS